MPEGLHHQLGNTAVPGKSDSFLEHCVLSQELLESEILHLCLASLSLIAPLDRVLGPPLTGMFVCLVVKTLVLFPGSEAC